MQAHRVAKGLKYGVIALGVFVVVGKVGALWSPKKDKQHFMPYRAHTHAVDDVPPPSRGPIQDSPGSLSAPPSSQ